MALVALAVYYAGGNRSSKNGSPSVEETTALLVGAWQSLEDPKSVVIFEEGGVRRDLYEGVEPEAGTWEVRLGDGEAGDFSGLILESVFYGESYEYSIWNVNESELVINYLARGNTLSYKRVDDYLVDYLAQDWELYANEEYGFAFEHPDFWEVQEALKPREQRALHEVVVWEKEYDNMWRGSLSVFMFTNEDGQGVQEWWSAWLAEEDEKEAECREEYGDTAPCLFLRGLVEREEATFLGGEEAITVGLFRFDHEEECTYAAHGEYIFGICAPAAGNPNDPKAVEHRAIAERIQDSFGFAEF